MSDAVMDSFNEITTGNGGAGLLSPERSASERFKIWFFQNRFHIFGSVSVAAQLGAIYFIEYQPLRFDNYQEAYEEVAFVSNLQINTTAAAQDVAEGEIQASDALDEKKEDPRIAAAVNPYQINATLPIDLSPSIKPDYTEAARKAGVEGMMVLELVIAEDGSVIRALPMKRLGFGLDEMAVMTYIKKKFQPAVMEGKPITVKVNIPVRFSLY